MAAPALQRCVNCSANGPFENLVPFVPRYTASQLGASPTGDRRNRKLEAVHLLTAVRCANCGYVHLFASDSPASAE